MSAVYDEPRFYEPRVAPEAGWTPPPPRPPRPPRRTHPGRLLAAAIAGLVLVGVAVEMIPPGTPGHQVWTSVVGAAPVAASSGASAAPRVDPQLAFPLDHTPRALNVSPNGADIAYTLAGVDTLQIADLTALQLETQIPTGASPHHPLFTPDGKLGLVVSQGPGTLDLFDPATYTSTGSIKVGTMPHWIGVTSDSRWAYVTNESSNDVSVVDLNEHKVTATVAVGNGPRKIVVQPGPSVARRSAGCRAGRWRGKCQHRQVCVRARDHLSQAWPGGHVHQQ